MTVHLTVSARLPRGVSQREIVRRATVMLRAIKRSSHELSIALVDDEQIHNLNRDYRNKDKPTDVLAFAQGEGELSHLNPRLLGDVIVSIPTAVRQGQAAGHPALAEVTMLLAHGLLHLCGWDHRTDREDRAMRAETARLCRAAERAVRPQPRDSKRRQTR